jgi:hypothetical protein
MGTGFTIATPLNVARYGISSVISLVDDALIEQMRQKLGRAAGRDLPEIGVRQEDSRARRIASYLDLLDDLVEEQVQRVRDSAFEVGSEITRYYQMLPDSPLRAMYEKMLEMADGTAKAELQEELRRRIARGSIDVNIMTKLDRDRFARGKELGPMFSDAMSALRGFASSKVHASVILSAGLNRRLFSYLSEFDDFFPDTDGRLRKKIILKVSDFRSALVQGKILAKKGLWVSEYRIESGLNCGGHAFGDKGHVLGPILEEFQQQRDKLIDQLHGAADKALASVGRERPAAPLPIRITVQGGIGTAEEAAMLHEVYNVDSTGWGSPFLLVPEVVSIDEPHLEKVARAEEEDVELSENSPLGIPFWSLKTSASEESRRKRIELGKPGSPCPKGFVAFNTEYTNLPICVASRAYQQRKLDELDCDTMCPEAAQDERERVLAKSCICHELSGGAVEEEGVDTAVCCGPNTVYFSKVATLMEMVDHIYGRATLPLSSERPHMFVKELNLHVTRLREQLDRRARGFQAATAESCAECRDNLMSSISYYREKATRLVEGRACDFHARLDELRGELEKMRG